MKSSLRILTGLIILTCFTNYSCKKSKPVLIDAVITGMDARACPCCGGLMITFNGETQPYKGAFFLIDNNPSDLGFGATEKYPVLVKVDTANNPVKCSSDFVNIIKLERR